MSDNPNEHDPEVTEMTRRLLGSWRSDAAPSGAKRATMAALGVGAAATTATATTSALGGAGRVGALGIAKALAGGALAGVVTIGTGTYIQHVRAPEAVAVPSPSATATARSSSRNQATEPRALPPSETATVPSPASPAVPALPASVRSKDDTASGSTGRVPVSPDEVGPPPAPPAPSIGATPSPDRVSTLAREIALLDQSRTSLIRGDAAGAIRLLDRYAEEFAHGNLGREAVVLRIEALLRVGDERSARALASKFAMDHPDDSHLARIRSLLTNVKTPTGDRP